MEDNGSNVNDYNTDESDEENWEELDDSHNVTNVLCLFCDSSLKSAEQVFDHCRSDHQFDLSKVKDKLSLDDFRYIRFINYIRTFKPSPTDLESTSEVKLFGNDSLLKPVIEDDGLLMYDIGEVTTCEPGDIETQMLVDRTEYKRLVGSSQSLERKCKELKFKLDSSMKDLVKIRSSARDILMTSSADGCQKKPMMEETEFDEDSYFTSYSHFGIHHEMLQDKIRTESYQAAICNNTNAFTDKVVLDVGCGTGILSMFAAKSGARQIFAVDQSAILYQAMDIVRENKLDDKIILLKGRIEDLVLPVDKVDVIISEWMGYFLLFEGMLDSIIYARDKHLAANGILLPNRCTLNLVALSDTERHTKLIKCWDDVYGFKMTCMKTDVIKEAAVEVIKNENVISDVCLLRDFDLSTCTREDTEFTARIELKINSDKPVTAFVGYFDCIFDCSAFKNKVSFSTGPQSAATHWKQTVFPLLEPVEVYSGTVVEGKLTCRRKRNDPRGLVVTIEAFGQKSTFLME